MSGDQHLIVFNDEDYNELVLLDNSDTFMVYIHHVKKVLSCD